MADEQDIYQVADRLRSADESGDKDLIAKVEKNALARLRNLHPPEKAEPSHKDRIEAQINAHKATLAAAKELLDEGKIQPEDLPIIGLEISPET